jgi:DNA topoisomerase-1
MQLVIVESPVKARTLNLFLGKEYHVVSTMGHIRDLPEKKLGIKIKKNNKTGKFDFLPEYVLMDKKKEAIDKLKQEAGKADKIFLATDPDREGEAIAWHAAQILGENGKWKNVARITFHEITKSAIEKSLSNPGEINLNLVDAQQARRVLDRLVGYKLSPLLWRKIRRGLSAGRVQSVAVRLIVDREREIEKFIPQEYWEIFAELRRHLGGLKEDAPTFLAKLAKVNGRVVKIENESQTKEIVGELEKANFEVYEVEKKEVFQNPVPPFTTSTLQQRAVQRLGFSSKRTMNLAQSLYEKGLITYHRTDSLNLAAEAIKQIRAYIQKDFGQKYLPEKPIFYKTKSKVAQEAHEAIRPTDITKLPSGLKIDRQDEWRLYDLIWKRALTCQMASAVWDQTKIDVQAVGAKNLYNLAAEGKVIKFDGWLILYRVGKQESERVHSESSLRGVEEMELPELKKNDELDLIKIDPQQKFTQPPARFTEATLIKALEEKGIGRPSTYAPIVSTIQTRQYVEKEEGKFKPTSLGEVVNDFLVEYFPTVFDYQFTANMEDELDDIANGQRPWLPVINDFYQPFEEKLTSVTQVAERVQVPTETTGKECPQCHKGQLVIRVGKFGKFLSCSRFPDCDYSAPFVQKLEGVSCPKCGGEIVIKKTRRGKQFYGCSNYPKCDWASWRKP